MVGKMRLMVICVLACVCTGWMILASAVFAAEPNWRLRPQDEVEDLSLGAFVYAYDVTEEDIRNDGGQTAYDQPPALAALDRKGWAATASHDSQNAKAALDGNLNTRWATLVPQAQEQWFAVDMGEERHFNGVVLDTTQSSGDYPRQYALYVSNDGENWGEPVASGAGSGDGATNINLPDIRARYIKMVQTQTGATSNYWSIHEFYVLDKGDVTAKLQALIDKVGNMGGGVIYMPAGYYKISGYLTIRKGVTLRGDWTKPEKGSPVAGTVLMAYSGREKDDNARAFIEMEIATGLMNLAIWYPEQVADDIKPYSPTIRFGVQGYFGNEYCNVKHVTLVNSYIGIQFSRVNGGASPIINGVYGTPLKVGIEIDNISDVGRLEQISFSPEYWAGAELPLKFSPEFSPEFSGAAPSEDAHRKWIYENGTGIIMRRNDWTYTCFVDIEGYKTGFHGAPSLDQGTPNGHNYSFNIKNCGTGIFIDGTNDVGIMFAKMNITDCKNGIVIGKNTGGVIQLLEAVIDASGNAVEMDQSSKSELIVSQAEIRNGRVDIGNGTFNVTDSDFNNGAPQIILRPVSRAVVVGNRSGVQWDIQNHSIYKSVIDHEPIDNPQKLPEMPNVQNITALPSRFVLYNGVEHGVKGGGQTDNTESLQNLMDKAYSEGGGIVFLPPGKYRVNGNLTVPTGVELKGAMINSSVPSGSGSIIEVYADKGNEDGQPFLKLSANSGVRDITFNYPEQIISQLASADNKSFHPNPYPYLMRGMGENVYVINVGVRATYKALDLFTEKCDNHYVDFLTGHVFNNGIKVGGGTQDGIISNVHFNILVYSNGSESKFGSWSNSDREGSYNKCIYAYGEQQLDFITLGDCSGQVLYNTFSYGSNKGLHMISEGAGGASGISLGLGVDNSRYALSYGAGVNRQFDFINTQIVSLHNDAFGEEIYDTQYIYSEQSDETGQSFTANLYNSDYWGDPHVGIRVASGVFNLNLANFLHPGKTGFAQLLGGKVNLHSSVVSKKDVMIKDGNAADLRVINSLADSGSGPAKQEYGLWKNNLESTYEMGGQMGLSRSDWTASASHNSNLARRALDGRTDRRWDTGTGQQPGQWFMVDMKEQKSFNAVILDASGSPNDGPQAYSLYTSTDGVTWGDPVKSGYGTSVATYISLPPMDARYIKVEQTGTTGNFWSIHEFYVLDTAPYVGMAIYKNDTIDNFIWEKRNVADFVDMPKGMGASNIWLFYWQGLDNIRPLSEKQSVGAFAIKTADGYIHQDQDGCLYVDEKKQDSGLFSIVENSNGSTAVFSIKNGRFLTVDSGQVRMWAKGIGERESLIAEQLEDGFSLKTVGGAYIGVSDGLVTACGEEGLKLMTE